MASGNFMHKPRLQNREIFLFQLLNLTKTVTIKRAFTILTELAQTGSGQYPVLARLVAAAGLLKDNKWKEALESYRAIHANIFVPEVYRRVAALRAGLILLDHGSLDEVQKTVTTAF